MQRFVRLDEGRGRDARRRRARPRRRRRRRPAHGGRLEIGDSPLGGARVSLVLAATPQPMGETGPYGPVSAHRSSGRGVPRVTHMTLTVAAVQMAMVDDVAANVATAERLVREAAAGGRAGRAASRSCSRARTSARTWRPSTSPAPGRSTATRPSSTSAPSPPSWAWCCRSASTSAPGRRRTTRVVDRRRRRRRARHLPQEPHPRRSRLHREVLLQRRRHRLPRVGDARTARIGVGICWDQWFPESARAMALLGAEVLLYPTAIGSRAARSDLGLERPLAARDAGPRRRQPDAARRRQPRRPRGRRDDRDHVLRLVVHRRRHGRQGRRGRPRRARPCITRHVRPRRAARRSATRGVCSAIAGPTCTARCSRSTASRPCDRGRHEPAG